MNIELTDKKVLIVPDLHLLGISLGNWLVKRNEAKMMMKIWDLSLNYDVVIFNGDIIEGDGVTWDEFIKTEIFSLLKNHIEYLKNTGIEVYATNGNHDPKELLTSYLFDNLYSHYNATQNGKKIRIEHGDLIMKNKSLYKLSFLKKRIDALEKVVEKKHVVEFWYTVFGLLSVFSSGRTLPGKTWNSSIVKFIEKLHDQVDIYVFDHTHYYEVVRKKERVYAFSGNAAYGYLPYLELINGEVIQKVDRY